MNTMRPTTSMVSRAVPALLAAVVVSIVLGIVGMHTLNTHGVVSNADHSAMNSHAAGPATGAHGDVPLGAIVPDGGDGHSLASMVMLCVAMLAAIAGAVVLLLLGLRRTTRIWAHRTLAPPVVTKRVSPRLGTGPPYLWQFSVIRC